MSLEKSCAVCDKLFISDKWHPNRIYCTTNCCKKGHHRLKRGLSIKLKFLNCAVCDKLFEQKRANNTDYCSYGCKRLGVHRRYQGLAVKGPRKIIRYSGHTNKDGYRLLAKKHPNSSKHGKILEHVLVMSNHLERPLVKGETVHHINGIRNDNRIENLELWSHSHPFGQRVEDKIKWCREFLDIYGFSVIKKTV
jgi:hypothetical protein